MLIVPLAKCTRAKERGGKRDWKAGNNRQGGGKGGEGEGKGNEEGGGFRRSSRGGGYTKAFTTVTLAQK